MPRPISARCSTPRGKLEVLAPKSLAVLELVDAGRSFADACPELEVTVFIEDELLDIVEPGFHLALRFGERPAIRRSCEKDRILSPTSHRHPRYLNRRGIPAQAGRPIAAQLPSPPRHGQDSSWRFADEGEDLAVTVHGRI